MWFNHTNSTGNTTRNSIESLCTKRIKVELLEAIETVELPVVVMLLAILQFSILGS